MNWFLWALLSAFFAGLTAVLAKVGVQQINSNMATAIRTVVILVFAWAIALATRNESFSAIGKRTWLFLILSGIATSLSWQCYFRAPQLGEASAGRSGGQAQRGDRNCSRSNFLARKSDVASLVGGHANFCRSSSFGVRVGTQCGIGFSMCGSRPCKD